MSYIETTIFAQAGVAEHSAVAKAALTRSNIFDLSQAAEDAVLRPRETGAFRHELRAALAARVARLADDATLAEHYLGGAGDFTHLADLAETGATHGLEIVLTFVDKVANQTRDIAADDIAGLQKAGIADEDIVRLCELVAFLAYQVRVISGLRLMQGSTP